MQKQLKVSLTCCQCKRPEANEFLENVFSSHAIFLKRNSHYDLLLNQCDILWPSGLWQVRKVSYRDRVPGNPPQKKDESTSTCFCFRQGSVGCRNVTMGPDGESGMKAELHASKHLSPFSRTLNFFQLHSRQRLELVTKLTGMSLGVCKNLCPEVDTHCFFFQHSCGLELPRQVAPE